MRWSESTSAAIVAEISPAAVTASVPQNFIDAVASDG